MSAEEKVDQCRMPIVLSGPEAPLAAARCCQREQAPFRTHQRCRGLSVGNKGLVIAVLTLFVLGCRLPSFLQRSDTNRAVTNSNTSAPTAADDNADTAPTGDARADVIRASKKFLSEPSFSATMDGEGSTPMHIELDYQHPDRFRMVNQAGPAGQIETIIIGRDMYIKHGERWQKIPGGLGKTVPQIRELFDEKGLESLKEVSYVGKDSVAGQETYVYSYKNEAEKGESPYPFTSKIWVRQSDGLPAKIQVDYEGGDLRTMTIVYDYEKPVSIEPPVK